MLHIDVAVAEALPKPKGASELTIQTDEALHSHMSCELHFLDASWCKISSIGAILLSLGDWGLTSEGLEFRVAVRGFMPTHIASGT